MMASSSDWAQNIFCALSQTIRMSRGTGLLRVASQGLSLAAIFPDSTDRPWFSEDGLQLEPK